MHPYQFSELTYLTAQAIGGNVLQQSTVTSTSSTTTLVDANRPSSEAADYWNDGTIWIVRDAAGASAAPEWEMSIVRDYDGAGTFTFDAMTAAPDTGDVYAVCKRRYPLHVLKQMVNQAIGQLGPVGRIDTSLTTAEQQTEYALPIAANLQPIHVHIQRKTDDSNDNQWQKIFGWEIIHGDPSTGDVLRLDRQYTAGYSIRIDYNGMHDMLFDYDDRLQEDVPYERVVFPAALAALKWYRDKTRTNDFRDSIRELEERVRTYERERTIPVWTPDSKILMLNRSY